MATLARDCGRFSPVNFLAIRFHSREVKPDH